ncbi:guided entry of tail-anchored proteins factor 1 [Tenacibaculum finnmarkense]|uniref:guided entry of tail-anchored proteins factor 1 n=1 Tax=Tenacibaculum finnmarkense TaxID=2781243 RepID=UPI001EFB9499|nr:guided entry of tail-anchored proteins factor 1 [Tenacibaculum finnmarkense]MCG8208241.1 hypothetical protein [Tenacibaculum finnmarkense genomovar finnmarkense]MCG8724197.1 hypothetical protein [Tenacibaculum finnmarkense]MCG8742556.1 hypothetical protein [Tenacibaculum finnmarkense]MCG8765980.1 hypothetical protein [Tenacibaculum finnmarkense]MCG8778890.1 hypothetical protein [Tenacibaculum finnmarkense]
MTVKERIKKFIKYKESTVRAFEKDIKASNGYINSINKNIGIEKLQLIIEQNPILNLTWLLTGKGKMLVSEIDKKGKKSEIEKENKKLNTEIRELNTENRVLNREIRELNTEIKNLNNEIIQLTTGQSKRVG